jgi:hypothetical protein
MTRHNHLRDFIDKAFARSTPLCRARFGELVADVLVDEGAAPQGFERALLKTDASPEASFAIITGEDPELLRIVPDHPERIQVVSDFELYAYWRPTPSRLFAVYDRVRMRGAVWFPHQIPAGAIGQPCEPLLHAAIEPTGWVVAHAAAVGREGRFLLLVGSGRSGKSTATLACVRAGWSYAGDDLVLLNPSRSLVAPLFSSVRLRHSGAAAFQSLADAAFMVSDDDGAPRYELRLDRLPSGGTVAAVLGVRRRGASEVSVVPARAADYLGPLLRDSTSRAPGCTPSMTPKLLAAGRMAPGFIVDTGIDPAGIPGGLGTFLETLP